MVRASPSAAHLELKARTRGSDCGHCRRRRESERESPFLDSFSPFSFVSPESERALKAREKSKEEREIQRRGFSSEVDYTHTRSPVYATVIPARNEIGQGRSASNDDEENEAARASQPRPTTVVIRSTYVYVQYMNLHEMNS